MDILTTTQITLKLEEALIAAHAAKALLQEFKMPKVQIKEAKLLLVDLKITIESLEGQIHQEES